jgi:cytochrome c-type biogenesis protein CcmH/NrfF
MRSFLHHRPRHPIGLVIWLPVVIVVGGVMMVKYVKKRIDKKKVKKTAMGYEAFQQ